MSNQKTQHLLTQGDARDLDFIPDEGVHLIVTSPPYWTLKRYREDPSVSFTPKTWQTCCGPSSR